VSDFGDTEPDDAFGTEGPDFLQVARKIHNLRRDLERLAGRDFPEWYDLPEEESDLGIFIAGLLIGWMLAEGTILIPEGP